jgi:hypothetical protein
MQWLDFCRNSHDNVGFNGDMLKCVALGLCLGLSAAVAQGPIVLQRGVLNAVTLEPRRHASPRAICFCSVA